MIPPQLFGFYLLILIVGIFVSLYGVKSLEDLIDYVELNIKYAIVRIKMYFLGRRLKRELKQMAKQFNKDKI